MLLYGRMVYNSIMMNQFILTSTAPLTLGEDGTIRISGSRVTLDSVLHAFQQGATAEQIQDSFPSLTLRDIYGAIAYYLEHQEQVEAYLREQTQAAEETRRYIESHQNSASLRRKIRARRARGART